MTVFNDIQMTKKAVKRVQFIYFQPLRALFKKDDETLSEQMKQLKEELKIKMNNDDETFNIDDYVLDECCDGRNYILIYVGE